MEINVLYAGDTQSNTITSSKGIDTWSFTYYSDSAKYLRDALNNHPEITCHHIPGEDAIAKLPSTVKDLREFDCLVVSDLGYNNIVFQPGNIQPFKIPMGPDRVSAIKEYVLEGGGFIMIGGWLTFSGLQGKGLYGGTKIEEIMPVNCEKRGVDDRLEITEGFSLKIHEPDHDIVKDLPWDEPYMFLGHNKVYLKDDATLIASHDGNPIIATREVGKGRSIVFTSDVGPHWGGSFLDWSGYDEFWQRMVRWCSNK